MPIELFITDLSPPSLAVLLTIKQLKLDVNIKNLDLDKKEQFSPEFVKLNPAHCLPTIVDDGFALWESRAIMQYLATKYAPNSSLYPSDLRKRAVVDRLLFFDMSIWYAIREVILIKIWRGVEAHENAVKNFKSNFKALNELIGNNKYVAGDELTIADLSYLSTLSVLAIHDYKHLDDYPNIKSWNARLQKELPYYEEVSANEPELYKQMVANK